ncbi:MAG: hypothetical protein JWO36_6379 [Myxococcales bacterium]|nr:hypothetical protein [Myxococcales bacterium]
MTFTGFDRTAPQFFHELTAEMNRVWFTANKERYEALWVQPMTALLEDVTGRLGKVYAPMKLGKPKLFRIYRDTRFSKDKTPYKTHCAGVIPTRKGAAAMYVHLGLDEEFIGVGSYFFDDKQLVKWRKLVAADKTGKEIAGIVGKLRKAKYPVNGHDSYKKVPKGFAPDHPRAELLKMRGLTAGFPAIPKGLLHKPGLSSWLVEHARATAPMVKWLFRHGC